MKRAGVCLFALAFCTGLMAHQPMSLDELTAQFGMNLQEVEITHEELAPGLYVLFGAGGNVVVSIGAQGVLMVDSQFPEVIPKLRKTIAELGGTNIDFTINTHWHFDHADGNPMLGREGTWLVSQINSRRMMVDNHLIDLVSALYDQPPYPPEALPVITYDDEMQFHFNGQRVDLRHYGPAHTTGDTAVIFRGSNAVHMGDVFNAGYPFIDSGNGGTISGVIQFVESIMTELNEDTKVVPGHGPVKGLGDLKRYLHMLKSTRSRVVGLVDQGYTLDQVLSAKPTQEFDSEYGDPTLLINRAYHSLTR